MARRSGSVWTGCGTVFLKEFADHLGSARMRVLEWLVLLTGIGAVYTAIQDLKTTTGAGPVPVPAPLHRGARPAAVLHGGAGFPHPARRDRPRLRRVNGEFNRRTMSRILAQPIYRDALLLGKFFAGLATIAVALVTLWLLVIGLGLLTLGVPPTGEEVLRGVGVSRRRASPMAGVWLAVAMLCSVMFRAAATSALVALGIWLLMSVLWPLLVAIHHHRDLSADRAQILFWPARATSRSCCSRPCRGCRPTRSSANRCWASCIPRPARSGPVFM